MNVPSPTQAREQFDRWQAIVGSDFYARDPHLGSLLRHHGRISVTDEVRAFGRLAATTLDPLARESNRDENLPRLRPTDRFGRPAEEVVFHPAYHELGRHVYRTGVMSRYREPGHEFESLCFEYLLSQNGEAGHACPLACTAGLIKTLQRSSGLPETWLERLLDPDYDTHFHGSQFLTEIQGGSDVGANAVIARPEDDGTWRLYGEKWFCSVIDAHLFLVTARPEGGPKGTRGVMAFAVPRRLDDGRINHFHIQRLKYKLGTRSMASAETRFEGAQAWPLVDFRDVVEIVLNTSRLYNATCSSGMMQRAWSEADAYARTRIAFGQPILAFPSVARIVARLRAESYAARASTFHLAALADKRAVGQASEVEHAQWRILVNLNKYWTSLSATTQIRDAIEVLGGNGAIEEFTVLPRLLRDSIVCEAWEGGHNVLCAQILKDGHRLQLHEALFDDLEARQTQLDDIADLGHRTEQARDRWRHLFTLPTARAALHIRDLVDELRPLVHATLLLQEARTPEADPLCAMAAEHLLIQTSGSDPLADAGLSDRLSALIGEAL